MPRESAFGRLTRHFHEHPQGRLHEFLFWAGLGVTLGAVTFFTWYRGWLSVPIALIGAVVSLCLIGWGLLPRAKEKEKPPKPGGKRGIIADQVARSKAEKKRKKGGVGPLPPIRRG